jgi:hypothetical protein
MSLPQIPTPEIDKMRAVKEKSQAIGDFLEWIHAEKDYRIGSFHYQSGAPSEELLLVQVSMEELLADYFNIDLRKVEAERQAILDHLRLVTPKDPEPFV